MEKIIFVQLKGFKTVKYFKALNEIKAPIQPLILWPKLKHALPGLKVPIDTHLTSNCIYKIICYECRSSYIGLSTRPVITRKKNTPERKIAD